MVGIYGVNKTIETSERILRDEGCKLKDLNESAAEGSGRWSNLRIEPFLKIPLMLWGTIVTLSDSVYFWNTYSKRGKTRKGNNFQFTLEIYPDRYIYSVHKKCSI